MGGRLRRSEWNGEKGMLREGRVGVREGGTCPFSVSILTYTVLLSVIHPDCDNALNPRYDFLNMTRV